MGCACCLPSALEYEPVPMKQKGLFQLTLQDPPERLEEFAQVLAAGFMGNTKVAGEAILRWCLEPGEEGTDHCTPWPTEPSEDLRYMMEWSGRLAVKQMNRHGSCFYITENDDRSGPIVMAAVIVPPNDRDLHQPGCCEMLYLLRKNGGLFGIPSVLTSGTSTGRMRAVETFMNAAHEKYAHDRHLYVWQMACLPDKQGKGYGSRMMRFIAEAADSLGVLAYLECAGPANEAFYKKFGFELKERGALEHEGDTKFNPGGLEGQAAMVRPPIKERHNSLL